MPQETHIVVNGVAAFFQRQQAVELFLGLLGFATVEFIACLLVEVPQDARPEAVGPERR